MLNIFNKFCSRRLKIVAVVLVCLLSFFSLPSYFMLSNTQRLSVNNFLIASISGSISFGLSVSLISLRYFFFLSLSSLSCYFHLAGWKWMLCLGGCFLLFRFWNQQVTRLDKEIRVRDGILYPDVAFLPAKLSPYGGCGGGGCRPRDNFVESCTDYGQVSGFSLHQNIFFEVLNLWVCNNLCVVPNRVLLVW